MNNDFNNSLRQEIQEGDKGDNITDTRETFLRWEKVFREVVEDEKKEIDFPQTAEEDLSWPEKVFIQSFLSFYKNITMQWSLNLCQILFFP